MLTDLIQGSVPALAPDVQRRVVAVLLSERVGAINPSLFKSVQEDDIPLDLVPGSVPRRAIIGALHQYGL